MIYALCLGIGLFAGLVSAAPTPTEAVEAEVPMHPHRELFPMLIGTKCARFCDAAAGASRGAGPMMSTGDKIVVKGPVKALEMLALNDDLNTLVQSDSMCTRRSAMARAAGLAAGLSLAAVNAPGLAAEVKICKGDTVTWTNNKGGPHNVVFDEDAIPAGVSQEAISMDDQLGDEGATFSKKFDTAGTYAYYCEPHRGAGMNANLIVS